MYCNKCGAEIVTDGKFCSECGMKVEIRCLSCKTVLADTAKFCHICGTKVGEKINNQDDFEMPPMDEPEWEFEGDLVPEIKYTHQEFYEAWNNPKQVEGELLGILDSETWKNLPYSSYMSPHSKTGLTGAANTNLVTIVNSGKLVIFDRTTHIYITLNLKYEDGTEFNNCNLVLQTIQDGVVYGYDYENIYQIDCMSGIIKSIHKVKSTRNNYRFINSMCVTNGKICYIIEPCESGLPALMIDGIKKSLSKKYCGKIIGSGADKLLITGEEGYGVYDINTETYESLMDYTFKDSPINPKNVEFYAIDLATHTVTFMDQKGLFGNNYVDNSIIQAKQGKFMRKKNIKRGKFNDLVRPHHCGDIYRDVEGHCVFVTIDYDFGYIKPDGTLQKLFHTWGACVPEGFAMIDNHTALIKTHEYECTIVDFAENAKYKFKF